MSNQIKNKVAIITGGLGVLGKSFAKAMCKHEPKGIVFADYTKEDHHKITDCLKEEFGENVMFVKADVTKLKDVEHVFDKAIECFKQVDIVANNAGVFDEDNFEHCLNVNVVGVARGTVLAIRKYLPEYKCGPGFIINTASVAGLHPIGIPIYCISKYAVVGMGLNFKADPACTEHDIRVITLCPGATRSPLMTKAEVGFKEPIPVVEDATYLGEGFVHLINHGKHGSVWMCHNNLAPEEICFDEFLDYTGKKITGK